MEALKVVIDDLENDVMKTAVVDSLRNAWQHRESLTWSSSKKKH